MPRKAVSLEQLYQVLDAEYRRARSPSCRTCVTPLPMRRTPADDASANWLVVEATDCPHQCRETFAKIVTRLMSEYELERSVFGVARGTATKSTTEP